VITPRQMDEITHSKNARDNSKPRKQKSGAFLWITNLRRAQMHERLLEVAVQTVNVGEELEQRLALQMDVNIRRYVQVIPRADWETYSTFGS
jgi:hypothetical protein